MYHAIYETRVSARIRSVHWLYQSIPLFTPSLSDLSKIQFPFA